MAISESIALYDEVLRQELDNPIFSSTAEINYTIKSLVTKGVLEDKIGLLKDREIEVCIELGSNQSIINKRVLKFALKDLDEKLKHTRRELYRDIFEPK